MGSGISLKPGIYELNEKIGLERAGRIKATYLLLQPGHMLNEDCFWSLQRRQKEQFQRLVHEHTPSYALLYAQALKLARVLL